MIKVKQIKLFLSIFLVFGITTNGIAQSLFNNFSGDYKTSIFAKISNQLSNPDLSQKPITKNVPDRIAESLFFRLLSKFIVEKREQNVRDYIKLLGVVDCNSPTLPEQDIDKILFIVRDYQIKVDFLDKKALEFKSSDNSNQLNALQKQKMHELNKSVQQLSRIVDPQTFSRFKEHINRLKSKVKIGRKAVSGQNIFTPIEEPLPDETGLVANMSDFWFSAPNSEEVLPEGTPPIFSLIIIGVGISEVDYDSGLYASSTTVSLVSNGNQLSSNTATGVFQSIAETGYTVTTDFGLLLQENELPEIQYNVQSTHAYSDSLNPYNTSSPTQNLPIGGYYFLLESVTFFRFKFRYTGYLYAGMGYGGCSGTYQFGYAASCPMSDECQKAKLCAKAVNTGIQGYGTWIWTPVYSWCVVYHLLVPFQPHCR